MNGLQLTGVSRSFGDRTVLHSMDLSVHRGEIVGFIGGNGAGKTTTMRLILGLLSTDKGEITWDGAPISSQDRRSIGYMPEERGLYPQMPVRDQVLHFALLEGHSKSRAKEITAELIGALGLQGREQTLIHDLSLGNQQRVQLAVSMVGDPSLLVLDEPFSGLDPAAVATMAELIREQAARGVGVLFSSHQLDLVERLCDRVCILDKGHVMASGSVAELQNDGQSRWKLVFSTNVNSFIAEASMIHGLEVRMHGTELSTVVVSMQGTGQDIPIELLAAAQRHGALRSIESVQRSLDELLTTQLISAGLGNFRTVEPILETTGGKQ